VLLVPQRIRAAQGFGARSPHQIGSSFSRHILVWGPVFKRAVRTTFIVFDTPVFQDNARLCKFAEEFTIQAFIAKLIVKALNMPVLPRLPGFM
jgi:hypothetical protein